jgi:hypothetical protein
VKKQPKDPIRYMKFVLTGLILIIVTAFVLSAATGCISIKPRRDGCKETEGMSGYGALRNHKKLK